METLKRFVAGSAILVLSVGILGTASAKGLSKPISPIQENTTTETVSSILTPDDMTNTYNEQTHYVRGETILGSYNKILYDENGFRIGKLHLVDVKTTKNGFVATYSGRLTLY